MVDHASGAVGPRGTEVSTSRVVRRRPAGRRAARRRLAALGPSDVDGVRGTRRASWDPLVGVTRSVRWMSESLGFTPGDRSEYDDRSSARVRGAAIVAAALLVTTMPLPALCLGVAGWNLPRVIAAQRRRRAASALVDETLLATELCAVAVHTGATVPQTVEAVAPYLGGRLGACFGRAVTGYHRGSLLDDRLAAVTAELGDVVAPLITVLRAAHVDGDPVEPALNRLADRMRDDRRRLVETEVRKLSVRLLVPLVCCSLPGFVLIAVVPLVLGPLGSPGP